MVRRPAAQMSDLAGPPFSWRNAKLAAPGDSPGRYCAALRAADNHYLQPHLTFLRS